MKTKLDLKWRNRKISNRNATVNGIALHLLYEFIVQYIACKLRI